MPRNHQFIWGYLAHVYFALHTLDKARERLPLEAAHDLLLEVALLILLERLLDLTGQTVEVLIPKGVEAVDHVFYGNGGGLVVAEEQDDCIFAQLHLLHRLDIEDGAEEGLLVVFVTHGLLIESQHV